MVAFLFAVHPASILQNRRDFLFFQVSRSTIYEIGFTKKTTNLLPPPFKTHCIKYREDSYFIEKEIKTRDQCISFCINRYKREEKNCSNYYSVLSEGLFKKEFAKVKICDHEHQVRKRPI